jgi:RNase P subunit RPR2
MRFSELAPMLWRSFQAKPTLIDEIVDEMFAEDEVSYFNEHYISPEDAAEHRAGLLGYLPEPYTLFCSLGTKARQLIIRERLLERADIIFKQGAELRLQRLREERKEKENDPNYIRPISKKIRMEVYDLDNYQCVFCGSRLRRDRGEARIVRLIPTARNPDELVTACLSCGTKIRKRDPESIGMSYKFGRFLAGGSSS